MSLAERIKRLRGKQSRREFAALVGISEGSLVKYENGERVPNADTIGEFSIRLDVTADWLIFGTEPPQKLATSCQFLEAEKTQPAENITCEEKKPGTVASFSGPGAKEMELSGQLVDAFRQLVGLQKEMAFFRELRGTWQAEKSHLLASLQSSEATVTGLWDIIAKVPGLDFRAAQKIMKDRVVHPPLSEGAPVGQGPPEARAASEVMAENALQLKIIGELRKTCDDLKAGLDQSNGRIRELEAQAQGFRHTETAGTARGVRASTEISEEDLRTMPSPSASDHFTTLDMVRPEKRK